VNTFVTRPVRFDSKNVLTFLGYYCISGDKNLYRLNPSNPRTDAESFDHYSKVPSASLGFFTNDFYSKFRNAGENWAIVAIDRLYSNSNQKAMFRLSFLDLDDVVQYDPEGVINDV
jgi:hypothetical protein